MNNTTNTTKRIAKISLVVLFLLVLTKLESVNAQLITSLGQMGNTSFAVEEGATTAPYTQSPTSITFNGSFSLGATLGGLFTTGTPKDWSSYSLNDFGLIMTITGINPGMPFTLELYNSSLELANTFNGVTTGALSPNAFVPLTLTTAGVGTMDDILGLQFTWDSLDSINAEWSEIAVVPEPSTTNLLILGSLAILGGLLFRVLKNNKKEIL